MTRNSRPVIVSLSVAVLAVLLAWSLTRHPQPVTAPPAAAAATPTPTYEPTAGDADDDHASDPALAAEAVWRSVVVRFARNFPNTAGGSAAWQARLAGPTAQPDTTAAVAAQLRTVDVANVPAGHYTGYQLVKSSAYEVGVRVDYREGWALVLYLITDGVHWQVYAYDKWEQ